MWSKKYSDCTGEPLRYLTLKFSSIMYNTISKSDFTDRDVLSPFLVYIKFHMIPASVLMTEIHPLGLVPYK